MLDVDLTWTLLVQALVAGAVVGLSALHWGWSHPGTWHRTEVSVDKPSPVVASLSSRYAVATWNFVLSATLAATLVLEGVGSMALGTRYEELSAVVLGVARAAVVVVAFGAFRALTQGAPVRNLVVGTSTWYLLVGGLWLATGPLALVGDGGHRPWVAVGVHLVPVLVLGGYVAHHARRLGTTRDIRIVAAGGGTSTVALVGAHLMHGSPAGLALAGLWVVPLAAALQVIAASRLTAMRTEADRAAQMREALAQVTNAAWFVRSPEQILDRARAEGRRVLGDPWLEGRLRPLSRDRFVAEFYSPEQPDGGSPDDPVAQAFLRDLARVVAGAAERHALTTRLRKAAFTDALTQLHNRPALDRHLISALERANVERSRVAVLFCDLDGFKTANDRYGHEWGDRVLEVTAEHLREVVGPSAFAARQGGDEFVVVLSRAGDDVALHALARRIRDEFCAPGGDTGPRLTVGIAVWQPGDIVDGPAILRDADLAMLEAKQTAGGVVFYDDDLRTRAVEQTAMRHALENGLGQGEIVTLFQPLTDAHTLEVVGLEALARWRRNGRLRRPAHWLAFAEETGLILEVGERVLTEARMAMERFELPIAVNVAAAQLSAPDFLAMVERAWGTDRYDRLTIEITESALIEDPERAREVLQSLADRGVRIAIDDFGTGYNSLARLGAFPLHILKIDRSFVQAIDRPEGAAVLRAIVALADAHGLEIVAEGVEHADELTALAAMGVGTVQGYMLGRPALGLPIRGTRAATLRRARILAELYGSPVEVPQQAAPAEDGDAVGGKADEEPVSPGASASA